MTDEQSVRDEIADEISGITVGSGYYSTTIGIDAAQEAADAIMPLIRRIQAEAWDAGFEKATDLTGEDFWSDTWSDDHNPYRGGTA